MHVEKWWCYGNFISTVVFLTLVSPHFFHWIISVLILQSKNLRKPSSIAWCLSKNKLPCSKPQWAIYKSTTFSKIWHVSSQNIKTEAPAFNTWTSSNSFTKISCPGQSHKRWAMNHTTNESSAKQSYMFHIIKHFLTFVVQCLEPRTIQAI